MIVGHLALSCIGKQTFYKSENFLLLIAAAYGPDIIDKTLSVLLGFPGRNIGHSLVVFLTLWAVTWACAALLNLSKRWIMACSVMWLGHLVGDFVSPNILLWPFFGSIEGAPFALTGVFSRMYVEFRWPGQLALETCLIMISLFLMAGVGRGLQTLSPARILVEQDSCSRDETRGGEFSRG